MATDVYDQSTFDMFKRKCGRPRVYQNNAEKQKAYRKRKKSTMSNDNRGIHHG